MKKIFLLNMLLFPSIFYFTSCQKANSENSVLDGVNHSQAVNTINAWVKAQNAADGGKNPVIKTINDNLDFDNLRFEEFTKGEKIIIVPINNGFKSAINKDKYLITNLLLVVNKSGIIRKGNIVQFIPQNDTLKVLPTGTFNKIYSSNKIACDGRFVFLNLHDKLLYQMDYSNGKLSAYGEKQLKTKSAATGPTLQAYSLNNCVDWYLVTTTYYADGTTTTSEEFMYTTCSAIQDEMAPPDLNGGGGGDQCSTDFNNLINNTSVANDMVTSGDPKPASNSDEYTKEFRWRAIKNLTWSIYSTENGVLKRSNSTNPNLYYKFVSLTHIALQYAGISIGGTIATKLDNAIPYVGIYNAGMQLSITLDYNPLGCPFVVPISQPYHCSQAFSAN